MVATQLATLLEAGVRLVFAPDPMRPVFQPPDAALRARLVGLLTPESKPAAQALLHYAVEYRTVLRRIFRGLAALVPPLPPAEAAGLLDAEARLTDELGVALADAVRAQVAAEWSAETGRCPWCGDGAHGPEDAA
jgi:hypothetical protein